MENLDETSWISKNWRACAAVAYLIICLFDFIIMPLIVFFAHDSFMAMTKEIAGLPPEVQRVALDRILGPWQPLTLGCNGIFHISFGSLISTMAWKHSSEVVESMRQMTARAALISNNVGSPTITDSSPDNAPPIQGT